MGSIVALFTYTDKGATPVPVQSSEFSEGRLAGDRPDRREGRKVLAVDVDAVASLGLGPGDLREQISITGVAGLDELEAGTQLQAGDAVFGVVKQCAPCLLIGEYNGADDTEEFQASLQGRRGVFLDLVKSGVVSVGDEVLVLEPSQLNA